MTIPYLRPVLYPGGFEIFEPLIVAVGADGPGCCTTCGQYVWTLDEGTADVPLVVCPCYFRRAKKPQPLQRLLTHLRELRAAGMVAAAPDWQDHWPDVAHDYGLVRRIRALHGDALAPSTIRAMASGGRYLRKWQAEKQDAWGRVATNLEGVRFDGARMRQCCISGALQICGESTPTPTPRSPEGSRKETP